LSNKTVKVARYRSLPYKINFEVNGGGRKVYKWEGSTSKKKSIVELPQEVVEWLATSTRSFKDGELVIIEDTDTLELIDDIEEYRNNTHSREDIDKLMKRSTSVIKKELEKVTNSGEKRFIINVVKELNVDSASKRKVLAEWAGTSIDFFDED
jgi:hypothetical protein